MSNTMDTLVYVLLGVNIVLSIVAIILSVKAIRNGRK